MHLEESEGNHQDKRPWNCVGRRDDVGDGKNREKGIGRGEGDAGNHEAADHGVLMHGEVASQEADSHGKVDAEVEEGEEDVGELELRLEEGLAVGVARPEGVHEHVREEGQDIRSVLHLTENDIILDKLSAHFISRNKAIPNSNNYLDIKQICNL